LVERESVLERKRGVVRPSRAEIRPAQVELRQCVIGIDARRLEQLGDGLIVLSLLHEHLAQARQGLDQVGRETERLPVFLVCAGVVLRGLVRFGEVQVRNGVVGSE
jgi:hypothetical protein